MRQITCLIFLLFLGKYLDRLQRLLSLCVHVHGVCAHVHVCAHMSVCLFVCLCVRVYSNMQG